MAVTSRLKNQHLLWRAAFGPMAENIADLDAMLTKNLWQQLVDGSAEQAEKITVTTNIIAERAQQQNKMEMDAMQSEQNKKAVRVQSREALKNLNMDWMSEMINSKAQLREKVAFFWHGHFASRILNGFAQQELLQIIRSNALGNFGMLLSSVSKSPSMLQFLNNQQNRKGKPNENFAREVMELFTMGQGAYSEKDVKEAARAFTGWGFNVQGEFVFRKLVHDDGIKTFLGKTGNFDGDDIIKILLEQMATAHFITRKIYSYFVNEQANEAHVKMLSKRFFASNYNILQLLTDIFTSDFFYEQENIGNKIKSPVELMVGIRRLLPLTLNNEATQLIFQRALGQILFYPPNVAGWPGGKNWIDSSTLMVRLQLPKVLAANESITLSPKTDDDDEMGEMMAEQIRTKKLEFNNNNGAATAIDWKLIFAAFEQTKRPALFTTIASCLLQHKDNISEALLANYIDNSNRESYVRSVVLHLMCTPEYQLC